MFFYLKRMFTFIIWLLSINKMIMFFFSCLLRWLIIVSTLYYRQPWSKVYSAMMFYYFNVLVERVARSFLSLSFHQMRLSIFTLGKWIAVYSLICFGTLEILFFSNFEEVIDKFFMNSNIFGENSLVKKFLVSFRFSSCEVTIWLFTFFYKIGISY